MRRSTPQIPPPSTREFAQLPPAPPPPSISHLDAELHCLSRGAGRLRLRIGQALHRLGDGIHDLGFSTLGAYALERCCRGGRWAAETRTLARRLESLPQLTAALETGSIGWSMAELLARHATPQTEAALLQIARDKTVQAMRIALTPQGPQASHNAPPPIAQIDDDNDDDLARTLSLTVPVEEAWALEATRMMVEHMDGKCTGGHFLESLLAEATISLLELTGPTEPDVSAQMQAQASAWHTEMQRQQLLHADAELRSRPAVPTNFTTNPTPGDAPDTDDLPTGLEALDARIRHYSAELASRDLFFGRLAQRFLALRGWQTLGFTSEAHYARERLGMSRASLLSKVSLARRTEGLHYVVDALQQGHIGFEAAQLITRIATPDTERAWVTRATRRTFKHLREEVQATEMATRLLGQPDHSPPTKSQLADFQSLERSILSGDLLRNVVSNHPTPDSTQAPTQFTQTSEAARNQPTPDFARTPNHPSQASEAAADASDEPTAVQISGGSNNEAPAVQSSTTPDDQPPTVQISGSPGSKVTLRIRVPGDLLLHYRQLERLHRQKLPDESFIQFLCTTFWQTWVPTLGTSDRWEMIYRRDRYRCTSPVCHQRNITLHHVKYRANGGTDHPDNLTSPCAFCHLEGEHGGRLKILPPGDNPTWLLGRRPIMRVHHRERTLLA